MTMRKTRHKAKTVAKSRVLHLAVSKCMHIADTNLFCGVGRSLVER